VKRIRPGEIVQAQQFVREAAETFEPRRIGRFARRLHEQARCVCCGSGFSLWRVNVSNAR
jgi:hypothetical protein